MNRSICLTVQSNGSNGYRLGISRADSEDIFKKRQQSVVLKLGELIICCKTACGVPDWNNKNSVFPQKKGYDLNKKQLSEWIMNNHFCCYPKRHPTKLSFSWKFNQKKCQFILEFISVQSKKLPITQ